MTIHPEGDETSPNQGGKLTPAQRWMGLCGFLLEAISRGEMVDSASKLLKDIPYGSIVKSYEDEP
jgi:hypothetical protein